MDTIYDESGVAVGATVSAPDRIELPGGIYWNPEGRKEGQWWGHIVTLDDGFAVVRNVSHTEAKLLAKYMQAPVPSVAGDAVAPIEKGGPVTVLPVDNAAALEMAKWLGCHPNDVIRIALRLACHRQDHVHQSEAAGWQDISTAPKDEKIDIWVEDLTRPKAPQYYRMTNVLKVGDDMWMVANGLLRQNIRPTHWRPLPAAPSNAAREQVSND